MDTAQKTAKNDSSTHFSPKASLIPTAIGEMLNEEALQEFTLSGNAVHIEKSPPVSSSTILTSEKKSLPSNTAGLKIKKQETDQKQKEVVDSELLVNVLKEQQKVLVEQIEAAEKEEK